jgi:hypothetical protein
MATLKEKSKVVVSNTGYLLLKREPDMMSEADWSSEWRSLSAFALLLGEPTSDVVWED